ncbi:MAG: sigma factor [Planctomycetota bacterium]
MTPCLWPLPQALASELLRQARIAAKHYGYSLSAQDRLDVAQEALVALFAKLRNGVSVENPAAWVMVAARNRCAMRWRQVRREVGTVSLSLAASAWDGDYESFGLACRCDDWHAVEEVLAGVPGLSDVEKEELRDVAAGESRTVAACTKEKLRNAPLLKRAKQR